MKGLKKTNKYGVKNTFNLKFLAPLWYWHNAPFLSESKKKFVSELTKQFVLKTIEKGKGIKVEDLELLLSKWSKQSQLDKDLEQYLKPKDQTTSSSQFTNPKAESTKKDVNNFHIGVF